MTRVNSYKTTFLRGLARTTPFLLFHSSGLISTSLPPFLPSSSHAVHHVEHQSSDTGFPSPEALWRLWRSEINVSYAWSTGCDQQSRTDVIHRAACKSPAPVLDRAMEKKTHPRKWKHTHRIIILVGERGRARQAEKGEREGDRERGERKRQRSGKRVM